jgi:methylated-DNA-[protein]-cysteine S-methyltransferase
VLETLAAGRIATPLGELVAVVDQDGALRYLDFQEKTGPTPAPEPDRWQRQPLRWADAAVAAVGREIAEYFAGSRRAFTLPVAPAGNDFHRMVWRELCRIPYGETISYGELARRVGRPGAARAVGRANGLNPIAIVVPCHRVIGADGKLTGYSGGIERKAGLLALERAATPLGQTTLPLDVAPGPVRRVR